MNILVVGSVNMDIVARVDHVPVPGENVRGWDLAAIPGGKGANQAVACARLGARTTLLGRLGDDEFGSRLRDNLRAEGVLTDALPALPGCPSGVALILVDAGGQNCIVITAGANGLLTPADLDAARDRFADADAVVLQLEIPAETVGRAVALAREVGTPVVVDAGPPRLPVDEAVFAADILSPNEAEAAALLGLAPGGRSPEDLARLLLERGPGAVVLKAGERGAVVARGGEVAVVPARRISPVDTTAAGDAFTAALTVAHLEGRNLPDAARFACDAGAAACLKRGAQPSMPTRADVAALAELPCAT
jgi:ribokinase